MNVSCREWEVCLSISWLVGRSIGQSEFQVSVPMLLSPEHLFTHYLSIPDSRMSNLFDDYKFVVEPLQHLHQVNIESIYVIAA